jgi:hypothetical protein
MDGAAEGGGFHLKHRGGMGEASAFTYRDEVPEMPNFNARQRASAC